MNIFAPGESRQDIDIASLNGGKTGYIIHPSASAKTNRAQRQQADLRNVDFRTGRTIALLIPTVPRVVREFQESVV